MKLTNLALAVYEVIEYISLLLQTSPGFEYEDVGMKKIIKIASHEY